MIGWYVHHVGRGHLHHALAITDRIAEPVVGLSSLDRPAGWRGDWIRLARDDDGNVPAPDAHGALHWAPVGHVGLQSRMSVLSSWIAAARPRALVVDVSVEVTVLARLLGVPVITFCLPGVRTDAPHQLAWRVADAIVAPWPAEFSQLCVGLEAYRDKVIFTGGVSRLPWRQHVPRRIRHGVVLGGRGGAAPVEPPALPGWSWAVLDARNWHSDLWPHLSLAAVVITHAGLGAIADVATARAPAVVVAQPRPFGEQHRTAQALATGRLAAVANPDAVRWPELVEEAMELGGCGWQRWADGRGAGRVASVIEATAERATSGARGCMSQS